jgi:hypothetical protein
MKRSINVYWGWENWSQWFTLREFSTYPPLRLITHLKKNYSNSLVFKEYFKCPAFTQYHKNTFVIKSDLSINFGFNPNNQFGISHYNEDFLYGNFRTRNPEEKVIDLTWNLHTFADQEVKISILPANFDINDFTKKSMLFTGEYDISKWFRPIQCTFKMLENPISIKRGDALYYIHFHTEKNIKLHNFKINDSIREMYSDLAALKRYAPAKSLKFLYDTFFYKKYNKRFLKEIKNNLTGY